MRKLPGDIDGQPFDLTSLRRCEVALLDRSEAVQVDELSGCRYELCTLELYDSPKKDFCSYITRDGDLKDPTKVETRMDPTIMRWGTSIRQQ